MNHNLHTLSTFVAQQILRIFGLQIKVKKMFNIVGICRNMSNILDWALKFWKCLWTFIKISLAMNNVHGIVHGNGTNFDEGKWTWQYN
jgi:hypothetical protein